MDRTQQIRETDSASAYLLTSPTNIRYACGFPGEDSQLLLTQSGSFLFTDSRYTQQAADDIAGTPVEVVMTSARDRREAIRQRLRGEPEAVLGIEKEWMSIAEFEAWSGFLNIHSYVDISQTLLRMRAIKSDKELEKISTAAKATEEALAATLPFIGEGVRECDIRATLIFEILKLGMDLAFEPIVAAGPNGAMPHARVSDYALQSGDLLTIDFGCRFEGYCADMTRTFAIGQIDDDLKTIYDVVEHAQQAALDAAFIGVGAAQIDAVARDYIDAHGYKDYFGHGTGHGVGLDIHELPVLNASSTDILEEGMVFTIEPGIYIPGLGGVRIEDTCIAGRGSLFTFPKTRIEL